MGGLFTLILVVILGLAMMAKVLLQHQIRELEAQYYSELVYHAQLKEQWGQMVLESAHLTAPLLVEQQARTDLKMQRPQHIRYLVLTEEPNR
ncbi:cell division protein FtsL [Thiomicrospira aerophila]|nr:cell division protein FtsL [Thiomicrospira aerophila]